MRRVLAAGLLALSALIFGCAKSADQPPPSPALWQISGENGEQGYLFGTIHALPDDVSWRTAKLDQAFEGSQVLVVEVDLLRAMPAMERVFSGLSHTRGLPPLSTRVEPAFRQPLRQAMADKGLAEGDFKDVESWAAALTLAQAYQTGDSGNGVDLALLRTAKGKPVIELEGLEPQLRLFDSLPEAEQRDLLEGVVSEIGESKTAGLEKERVNAWLTGNTKALVQETTQGLLADPELRTVLLTQRNQAWANRIDVLLERKAVPFVAVGAAHLVGPQGLAALLAAKGYKLQRIQ